MAEGSFIQFVDGDDLLLTSAYEQCLDIIRYRETDMVLFQSSDKKSSKPLADAEGPISGTEYMTHNNLRGSVWTFLFRKEILHDLRFPKGILHEDEEFTPQLMLRAENLYFTNNKAYYYRKREGSIMHKRDKRWHIRRLSDAEPGTLSVERAGRLSPCKRAYCNGTTHRPTNNGPHLQRDKADT